MLSRAVKDGPQPQGVDEQIAYIIDTTPWGGTPTSPSAKAFDVTNQSVKQYEDVTSSVFPTNSPAVSGDDITLSLLRNLTLSHRYRIEVQFTIAGNLMETWFYVDAER